MIRKESNLKLSFYAKKNEVKDGSCPIMGRITIGKSMVQFSTKIIMPLKLWDTQSGRAVGKSKIATSVNRAIDKIIVSVNMHYNELCAKRLNIDADDVKSAFQGIEAHQAMLLKSFKEHNVEFRKRVGVNRAKSTAEGYETSYVTVSKFIVHKYKVDDVAIRSLDLSFIESYDFYMRIELQLMPNTIVEKVRHLRRIIKLAIHYGVISNNPFNGFTAEGSKPEQKYLNSEDLNKIITTPLDNQNQYFARDIFLLSAFTGLAYCDICNLTHKSLIIAEDGVQWLSIYRQKTNALCNIPLLPLPLQIIKKYKSFGIGGALLPKMSASMLNYHLRKIVEICGIHRRVTLHSGRHTYASQITLSQGVPIETASKMLGHKHLSTTQIYAKITNNKIGEDMRILEKRIVNKYQLAQV